MLIILACSKTKKNLPGKACDVYDGVFYRIAKKSAVFARYAAQGLVYILSAKYGLINWNDTIEPYDLVMNKKIADSIKVETTRKLKQIVEQKKVDNITVVMGKHYRHAVDWKALEITTLFIYNDIGLMKKEFKDWLSTLPEGLNG